MDLPKSDFLLKNFLEPLISEFNEEIKNVINNRLLEYQVAEYKRNYFSRSFLHRGDPVKLDSFYFPLTLIHNYEHVSTKSIKDLNKRNNFIFIIGSAGSGKSTLIKSLFIQSLREKFKIPIKIELRHLNDSDFSLKEHIINLIVDRERISNTISIAERTLTSGKFVFFFDGLDEVMSSKKSKILHDIEEFCKSYSKNFFILTSRPHSNNISPSYFSEYFVSNLTSKQIPKFIIKQLGKENEFSEKIIKAITEVRDDEYKSFLVNPLLLSMFIMTYQSYSSLPAKKSTFYYQVFETMFYVHDSFSKLGFERDKQSKLSKEQFEEVLEIFSFLSFFSQKIHFDSIYLNKQLNLIKEKKANLGFENRKIIEDFEVAIGILVKEGIFYTFPHRSLQEYFTASYISKISNIKNKQKVYKKIQSQDKRYGFYILNIYNLLYELDYVFFNKNYALPSIKSILRETKKMQRITADEFRDFHNWVEYIGIRSLRNKMRSIQNSIFAYLGGKSGSTAIRPSHMERFIVMLETYIEETEFELNKNDSGDKDLIDMI